MDNVTFQKDKFQVELPRGLYFKNYVDAKFLGRSRLQRLQAARHSLQRDEGYGGNGCTK